MGIPPTIVRIFGRLALAAAIALPLYLGIYRPRELRWGATGAEVARALPGDEIVHRPIFAATRAITIDAPPEAIWPWLVQIGYQRAGWYSGLDWLDNTGVPSAERIVPELQHLEVGDPLPVWVNISHRIIAVEPNRYLLEASPGERDTWLWALEPIDASHTRLIWRMRNGTYAWTSPGTLAPQLATDLGDFVVVRNILLGLKERAEGRPIGSLAASTPEVILWLLVFGAFLASLAALVVRRDWLRPLLAIGATYVLTLLLAFAMPPLWVDTVVAIGVYASLWWLYRTGNRAERAPAARLPVVASPAGARH